MSNETTNDSRALGAMDTVGAVLSFTCAVHCILLPFVLTLLPLVGLSFLGHSDFEEGMIIVMVLLAALSLCWGTRVHRQPRILLVIPLALLLFWLGGFTAHGPQGAAFVTFGGLCLVAGHLLNRRLCRSCHSCGEHSH